MVFAASPSSVWAMLEANEAIFDNLNAVGAEIVTLAPWHDQAVRQWLDDCGFAASPDGRKRIREATGSWPALLYRFYERACGDEAHWEKHLDDLRGSAAEFGLEAAPASRVASALAIVSPASEDYIVTSVQEEGWAGLVRRGLEWGRRLNLLRFSTEGKWEADPIVQQFYLG